MKLISLIMAFINTLMGGLLVLSCVSSGESAGWVLMKTSAGTVAAFFGILTFKDSIHPVDQSKMLMGGLFLVIVGVSALAYGIHWSILSGDLKNAVLFVGGCLFLHGVTAVAGIANGEAP